MVKAGCRPDCDYYRKNYYVDLDDPSIYRADLQDVEDDFASDDVHNVLEGEWERWEDMSDEELESWCEQLDLEPDDSLLDDQGDADEDPQDDLEDDEEQP